MSFLFSQPAPGIVPIDSISFAELAKVDASSVLGNPSGSLADASSITFTNLTSLLDPFAGTLQGLVPASSNTGTLFLRDDGTWVAAGGGLPAPTIPTDAAKVVAVDSSGAASWQYAGLGDGNFSTASLILGRGKPTSSTGTKLTLLGTLAGNSLTSGNASVLIGDIGKSITTGLGNIFIGYEYIDGFPQSGLQPVAATTASVGIGISLRATGSDNVAIGYFANTISDSVAIGSNVTAGTNGAYGGVNHVAIGKSATIYAGDNCVTIGYGAYSANNSQIAIGSGASSGGNDAVLGPKNGAINNVVVGTSSGYFRNTGGNNTVLGTGSFNSASLTTAANNTIVGQGSATALTTGSRNVILGQAAGTNITTASDCFLVNANAYLHDQSGDINVLDRLRVLPVISCVSLGSATISSGAVIIGHSTGGSGQGVCIGKQAGLGSVAVSIGDRSGSSGVGTGTVAVGSQTGEYGISQYSVAIGYTALKWNGSAGTGQNTAIGNASLHNNSGSYNLGLGTNTLYTSTSQNNLVGIGAFAGYRATTSNEFYLDSRSSALASNALEKTNSLMYGQFNATPSSQTLTINAATTSTYGLIANEIGGDYDSRIEGVTDPNLIFVDASADNVGIGTSTPSAKLDVANGDIAISTEGNGLAIKTGANAKIGTVTMPGVNPNIVSVSTSAVTANSMIFITAQTPDGGLVTPLYIESKTVGSGFEIKTADNSYNGDVGWMIVEATP